MKQSNWNIFSQDKKSTWPEEGTYLVKTNPIIELAIALPSECWWGHGTAFWLGTKWGFGPKSEITHYMKITPPKDKHD